MKAKGKNPAKEHYQKLRILPWQQLWEHEVPRFNKADATQRMQDVALVRAVGVVFSESGAPELREDVAKWLSGLLSDPQEKIRRYAMAALPKIGMGAEAESDLLELLKKTSLEREKKFLGRTLGKIGGEATLEVIDALPEQVVQKVKANVARGLAPGSIRLAATLHDWRDVGIHLRGRRGLEGFVKEEVETSPEERRKFRVTSVAPGLVVLAAKAPFSLADLCTMRCFGTLGLVLGTISRVGDATYVDELAQVIASPLSQRILRTLTDDTVRYRLDFISKGHQRHAVREVAAQAFKLCPAVINDARNATWAVDIHPTGRGVSVELRPRFSPDPRFAYRRQDVPAASHPPLAACMARMAGNSGGDVVWDPFCGSGLELIERARLGSVARVFGTDLSSEAVGIAKANLAEAKLDVSSKFVCCDFRDLAIREGLQPGSITQIITNPPLGRRVPIHDLNGLIDDLFATASLMLRPGGRLVLANPLPTKKQIKSGLHLDSSQVVDFGGFDCRLECYTKRV